MGGNPIVGTIFMYGAIFAIFYFILIRPQQMQRKKHDETIRTIKKGDEIVTQGGLVGEVISIRETAVDGKTNPMEDRIVVKSGETRVVIERGRIARISRSAGSAQVTAG